ncbi:MULTISPECIES: A/G-specific adenine glycosylase [Bacteroides]|uniref:A/G-specific adenine glycosylase n=1 Tax=Bacteroides TaxID=816 RepID=UPI001D26D920|nr:MULTISPECIES: A/G-specific adenine glycosylase [Bacteroides]HJD91322.1 A/G-specific adenine glycosylase [Bacteroides coprosuis]
MEFFGKEIEKWFDEYGRDLPWRKTKDPYLIWISEVILQQTRVVQGFDYYMKFKTRFPNVEALASAEEDEVLKYWQGLGYYSRARNLHAAAKSIQGDFPSTYKEVLALKGVGAYTAAAICSFAYDMPYAVVDGNVYRVLSRYLGISTPIDSSLGKKEFSDIAQELLDKNNPAKYNQAIMDFGAIQCVPKNPACEDCPLVDSCYAYAHQMVSDLPVKKGKVKVRDRYLNFFYIVQGDYTYIEKRVGKDIWQNLYQLPLIESDRSLPLIELLEKYKTSDIFLKMSRPSIKLIVDDYKHILSHQHLHTTFYQIEVDDNYQLADGYLKIKRADLDEYAIPRLIHLFLEKYIVFE